MGPVKTKFRGTVEETLTATIDSLTDVQYQAFLDDADDNAHLPKDKKYYEGDKTKLKADLGNFSLAVKEMIVENLQKGQPPFGE